jgi:M6 family metalloprotease-like protein
MIMTLKTKNIFYSISLLFLLILLPVSLAPVRSEPQTIGEQTIIVILVEFTDIKHNSTYDEIYNKVFVEMNNYFRDISHGLISTSGTVNEKWYTLNGPISYYAYDGKSNLSQYFKPFVKEVIETVDEDIDFRDYDRVVIFHAGSWQQFGNISFALWELNITTDDGVVIDRTQVNAETDNWIVVAHEFAHVLGQLPDLYDMDLFKKGKYEEAVAKYVGPWDLMSSDFRYWTPTLSAWNLLKLGWFSPTNVLTIPQNQNMSTKLDPLHEVGLDTLNAVRIELLNGTYYLVEVRQKDGYDSRLPDYGMLVTLIDESIPTGKGPARVVDSNPGTTTLDDATFDLRLGKIPVFLDKQNDLAIIIRQKVNMSYVIEIGNYTLGQEALVAFENLTCLCQTLNKDFWVIDFLGSGKSLEEAYKMYELGRYAEAQVKAQEVSKAHLSNMVLTVLIISPIIIIILWLIVRIFKSKYYVSVR